MLNITIQNGIFTLNDKVTDLKTCTLGDKVKEVFNYFMINRIDLQLTKYASYISYNTLRVDASNRLIQALEQDNLIRPNRLLHQPA